MKGKILLAVQVNLASQMNGLCYRYSHNSQSHNCYHNLFTFLLNLLSFCLNDDAKIQSSRCVRKHFHSLVAFYAVLLIQIKENSHRATSKNPFIYLDIH